MATSENLEFFKRMLIPAYVYQYLIQISHDLFIFVFLFLRTKGRTSLNLRQNTDLELLDLSGQHGQKIKKNTKKKTSAITE